jgi:hypothetical protein
MKKWTDRVAPAATNSWEIHLQRVTNAPVKRAGARLARDKPVTLAETVMFWMKAKPVRPVTASPAIPAMLSQVVRITVCWMKMRRSTDMSAVVSLNIWSKMVRAGSQSVIVVLVTRVEAQPVPVAKLILVARVILKMKANGVWIVTEPGIIPAMRLRNVRIMDIIALPQSRKEWRVSPSLHI